jgi:glycosyltransferase involved in cell wall biosynthesis
MLVALALRKRLIARYCSSWETTTQTTLMNRVTRQCMRRFAGGGNVMLATGAGDAPPAAHMHWVFSTAISQSELAAHQPDLLRASGQPLRIAYVGRLAPEKGVVDLIEALGLLRSGATLPEQMPRLTIIGDGPQRPMLAARIKQLGYGDRVDFTGQLDRVALLHQLSAIDLCVLPSLTESFCKARLDAMLCGVPIITTDVGFGREIVGHDGERGWLVPAGDAPALANRLQQVMHDSINWPAMRSRCRSFVEMHTLEMWGQQIGQICARQWQLPFEDGKLYA